MLPLICIDVDGTLVGASGSPTDAVWAAADAAVDRGQHLTLTTARGAFGPTYGYAQRLDPDGWHIFHSGAALVHTGTGAVREHPLSDDVIALAAAVAADHDWVFEYYAATDYTVESNTQLAVDHAALMGVDHRCRTVDDLDGGVLRVQFVVPTAETSVIEQAIGDAAMVTAASSPIMAGTAFVSVTAAGVDKASAIAEIARILETDMAQVMMVGDGPNDLEAVRAVGHGTAMGNAEPAVKAVARHHVADVEADGLAEALALSATL